MRKILNLCQKEEDLEGGCDQGGDSGTRWSHWGCMKMNSSMVGLNNSKLMVIGEWFQNTLYKRVLLNITNQTKKHPFCGAHFSTNI